MYKIWLIEERGLSYLLLLNMTSTPNMSFNKSEGPKFGKLVVSGTLSFVMIDEEEGRNVDSWSLWSEASTIPVRRGDSVKEISGTAVEVDEPERMEDVIEVNSEDDEHQVTLKEILSSDNTNSTINIEEEPMEVITDKLVVEPELEKPEAVRQFNVQ